MKMKDFLMRKQAMPQRDPQPIRCAAIQYSDQMVCARCDLSWDTNDSEPPHCKVRA